YPRSWRNCLAASGVGSSGSASLHALRLQRMMASRATWISLIDVISLFRAGRNRGGLDANWNLRLLIFRGAIDRVSHFHSPEHAAERRELAIEMRAITD